MQTAKAAESVEIFDFGFAILDCRGLAVKIKNQKLKMANVNDLKDEGSSDLEFNIPNSRFN
jgi:hypothetical protein